MKVDNYTKHNTCLNCGHIDVNCLNLSPPKHGRRVIRPEGDYESSLTIQECKEDLNKRLLKQIPIDDLKKYK